MSVMPDKCVLGALSDLPTEPLTYGAFLHDFWGRIILPTFREIIIPANLSPDVMADDKDVVMDPYIDDI